MSAGISPIRKHRTSFANHAIFGPNFKSGQRAAEIVTADLLLKNKLNIDGTINENLIVDIQESELWSYIYYLYSYNNSKINEFMRMKGDDEKKASAEHFYDVVRSVVENTGYKTQYAVTKLNNHDLIMFIKKMISKYGSDLYNPVVLRFQEFIDHYYAQFINELDVVVRTGSNGVKIVRDEDKAASSDIVIKIGMS